MIHYYIDYVKYRKFYELSNIFKIFLKKINNV